MRDAWRHFAAEFIGTFAFVFVGSGAIMTARMSQSPAGLLEVALCTRTDHGRHGERTDAYLGAFQSGGYAGNSRHATNRADDGRALHRRADPRRDRGGYAPRGPVPGCPGVVAIPPRAGGCALFLGRRACLFFSFAGFFDVFVVFGALNAGDPGSVFSGLRGFSWYSWRPSCRSPPFRGPRGPRWARGGRRGSMVTRILYIGAPRSPALW